MRRKKSIILKLLITLTGVLAFGVSVRADIAVVVNPKNPINELTDGEVKRIFLGRMQVFPQTDERIQVFDQHPGSGTYQKFYEELIGFELSKLQRYRAAFLFSGKGVLPTKVEDAMALKAKILSETGAIGYLDTAQVDDTVKVVFSWENSE